MGQYFDRPLLARVFSNDDSSGIVFVLKLPKLEKGGGWAGQFQHYVEGTFRCDGKAQAVRENYRRSSAIKDPPAAFAVVVNDALIDLVEKGNTFAGKCAEKKSDLGPAPKRDKYTDLERLKNLLDDGAITQDEYDREKTKILNERLLLAVSGSQNLEFPAFSMSALPPKAAVELTLVKGAASDPKRTFGARQSFCRAYCDRLTFPRCYADPESQEVSLQRVRQNTGIQQPVPRHPLRRAPAELTIAQSWRRQPRCAFSTLLFAVQSDSVPATSSDALWRDITG